VSSPPPATPRRRGPRAGGDTREAIVAAAREEFASKGYAAATVRSIGARAGVDAAMINHYFGGKAGLFREVTHIPIDPMARLAEVLAGPREGLGERIAGHMLATWEDAAFRDPVLALMRSSTGEPSGARLLREFLQEQLVPVVAGSVRGPDPQQQVALAMAHLLGIAMGRHVVGLDVLRAVPVPVLAAQVGPTIQRYLDGTHLG
jgi:AcrR family transcriptional regulator